MIPFTLQKAGSEAEALAAAAAGARFIAGGTTLVDLMREHVEQPAHLVDINALPLNHIHVEGDELVIGALARMSDVAAHADVCRLHPVISESLVEGASPQLRNMASIGGNLLQRVRCPYFRMLDAACNKRSPDSGCAAVDGLHAGNAILGVSDHCSATHPSDLAVALVALDAVVHVRGPHGARHFPVEDLYVLPGTTPHLEHSLRPGELIVEVRIPPLAYARTARYLKVRDRASYEFALVSAAAAYEVRDGAIQAARLACGGVGTRPWRMRAAELALQGKPPTRASFEAAALATIAGATPLPGNRYKVALLQRTVVRALELAGEGR
ncbi:FAD binding domain-containing protein [Cupriavidus consociatus]|uniref:FAD binding domain-containing protein n=1 Tax=Cupriavidus consociatus TaxID=2821357 RepID=UPI001AE757BB|nr:MULTISPECIES: xanthine dehydrogenase family protein subunit M [unclassified Cupriavidus]MBP0625186.1 xanthine dehydrogenase family protein subunit M [Cupriavidus sp. LEh25]MDK2661926.1 xanthine dehydrogenase family protein subunit M [Cupriavidus sp. LEh21]